MLPPDGTAGWLLALVLLVGSLSVAGTVYPVYPRRLRSATFVYDLYRYPTFDRYAYAPEWPTEAERPPSSPVACGGNETFRRYDRPCGKSCGTFGQICPRARLNRCLCAPGGYVRNKTGHCIHYTDCNKRYRDVELLH